ncbi:MAG TPA: DUF4412 domain-containing protein [Bryobacteraceae bacterium]|nr:DUF4412 domain-containing protein [Bryobacteraceae bacterium]
MYTVRVLVLALAVGAAARADFSYTMSRQASGATAGAMGAQGTKYYLKGQKMMIDLGMNAIIMDFDAQTFTSINKTQKTYTVTPFSQAGAAAAGAPAPDVQLDIKETGQHKNINGFDATQTIINVQADMPQAQGGMKMSMEMELWVSPDVPGAEELHAFYQRNGSRFPWNALASGNPNSKAMLEMQRKLASMNGVPVLEVMRMKPAGGSPAMPSMTPEQSAQMAQARARLEAMAAQGGPAGDAAKRALAGMGAAPGGGAGGSMFEITMESSGFSTNSIPGDVFAVPAGFSKAEK